MTHQAETATASSPIQVLLWSPTGSGEHYSGPATFSYRLYRRRNPRELEVSLAHGFPQQPPDEVFRQQFMMARGLGNSWDNIRFIAASTHWMREHAKRFDIVHGMSAYHPTVRPCFAAHRQGVPTVIMLTMAHGGLADKGGLKRILGLPAKRRVMAKHFEAVVALSHEVERELLGYGFAQQRIVPIPNFADTNRFVPIRDSAAQQEMRRQMGLADLPTIVFVGEVCARKQPHLIVEALAEMRIRGFDAQAVFVGPPDKTDPTYTSMLTSKVRELGLQDRVKLTGFCTNVEQWNQAADVFCLPSKKEGMPGALVEAMASGLPSVVTRFSGASDVVVNDQIGRLVESRADDLLQAFLYYLESPEKLEACRVACRTRAEAHFSAESVYRAHLRMFQRILAGQDARG